MSMKQLMKMTKNKRLGSRSKIPFLFILGILPHVCGQSELVVCVQWWNNEIQIALGPGDIFLLEIHSKTIIEG